MSVTKRIFGDYTINTKLNPTANITLSTHTVYINGNMFVGGTSTTVNKTEFKESQISNSNDAYQYIRQFYGHDIHIYESSFILLLNRANKVTGYAKISQGGICGTVVDIRIILKYCVESLCCNVILAHNHPSGALRPSGQDIEITKKIAQSLKLMDISLFDHIILTAESFYSMADNGDI
jgi:DNA repair protein RadC